MVNREIVEIEAGEPHDRVVCILLPAYGDICCLVPDEGEVVVAGMDRFEEGRTSSEQWNILNVWIMLLEDCQLWYRSRKCKTYRVVS